MASSVEPGSKQYIPISSVEHGSKQENNINVKVEPGSKQENETSIVLVLDESGSMDNVKEQIIASVNNFVDGQKNTKGKCNYTLIKFANKCETVYNNIPISEVEKMTLETYKPGGMTALYDAIGSVFTIYKNSSNVILVIVTDGRENSSMTFTKSKIKQLMDIYTDKNAFNWNVIYLAADPSLQKQGEEIGISGGMSRATTNNVAVDFNKFEAYSTVLTRAVSAYRENDTDNIEL